MTKTILTVLLFIVVIFGIKLISQPKDLTRVAQHLLRISLTITSGTDTGSGVAFSRKDSNGKYVTFVWTVAHVVRYENPKYNWNETDDSDIPFECLTNVDISQDVQLNGKVLYRQKLKATIIKCSPIYSGQDLALLKVEGVYFNSDTVSFYNSNKIPPIGTQLITVGSPYGLDGIFSSGYCASVGKLNDDDQNIYDQTTLLVFPGSSGSGVFLVDGRCIGLCDRWVVPNLNFIIPIRRIQEWARQEHVEWALNPSIPMPSDKELKQLPILDTVTKTNSLDNLELFDSITP